MLPGLRHHGKRSADLIGIQIRHKINHDLRHRLDSRLCAVNVLTDLFAEVGKPLCLLVDLAVDLGQCCRHRGRDLVI